MPAGLQEPGLGRSECPGLAALLPSPARPALGTRRFWPANEDSSSPEEAPARPRRMPLTHRPLRRAPAAHPAGLCAPPACLPARAGLVRAAVCPRSSAPRLASPRRPPPPARRAPTNAAAAREDGDAGRDRRSTVAAVPTRAPLGERGNLDAARRRLRAPWGVEAEVWGEIAAHGRAPHSSPGVGRAWNAQSAEVGQAARSARPGARSRSVGLDVMDLPVPGLPRRRGRAPKWGSLSPLSCTLS